MISVEQALGIHEMVVKQFGGSMGVRDAGGLESALARPFQTFGGEDLYPDLFSKAAAIGESIIINHPFIDGNKRTGYVLMESILKLLKEKTIRPSVLKRRRISFFEQQQSITILLWQGIISYPK